MSARFAASCSLRYRLRALYHRPEEALFLERGGVRFAAKLAIEFGGSCHHRLFDGCVEPMKKQPGLHIENDLQSERGFKRGRFACAFEP